MTSVDKNVEKLESSLAVGRDVKWARHFGKFLAVSQNVIHKVPHYPATPPLNIYTREIKAYVHKETCT